MVAAGSTLLDTGKPVTKGAATLAGQAASPPELGQLCADCEMELDEPPERIPAIIKHLRGGVWQRTGVCPSGTNEVTKGERT